MSEQLKGEKDIININHMYLMSPKKITNHWSPVIQVLTWMAFLFANAVRKSSQFNLIVPSSELSGLEPPHTCWEPKCLLKNKDK